MIGKTVSHYKLLEKVGQGGMGIVYKAEDLTLQRIVALKFLPEHSLSDETAVARFRREARAAAALDHPNICTVYEIGEYEGQTFIVMAFLKGESLHNRIQRGPMKLQEAIDIAVQIAEGLDHAHSQGIVHRDIKSSNIIVTVDGTVKIVDFGLAKHTAGTSLTETGIRYGTVRYMSPEQARGEKLDYRTDIWSLGVLVYEMLTGVLPFPGDIDQAVVYQIINVDPEPVTSLRTGVPLELERIIFKALAKEPDQRYQHADEMVVDLRGAAGYIAESVSSTLRPSDRQGGGRRLWIPVIGGLGFAIVVLIISIMIFFPSESVTFNNRDWILITDFENQTGEDHFEGTIREALSIDIQQSQYVNVYGGQRLAEALKRMERLEVADIDPELGREICIREGIAAMLIGTVSRVGKAYAINAKIVVPATGDAVKTERVEARNDEEILEAVDELSEKIRRNLGESLMSIRKRDEPLHNVTTSSLDALKYATIGRKHLNRGNNEKAIPFLEQAIAADSSFAMAYAYLGVIYNNKGNVELAMEMSTKALEWADQVSDRERYFIEAEYYRVRSAFEKSAEKYKMLTEFYPDDFGGHNNLAFLCQSTRQYEDALKSIGQAAKVSPNSWFIYHNTALSLAGLGEFEKAVVSFEQALEANPKAGWSHIGLSWVKMFLGDYRGALLHLDFEDEENYYYFRKRQNKAYYYLFLGKENAAIEHLENEIQIGDLAAQDWAMGFYRRLLGILYLHRNEPGAALEQLQQSNSAWRNPETLLYLGKAYIDNQMNSEVPSIIETLAQIALEDETYPPKAFYHLLEAEYLLSRESYEAAMKQLKLARDYYDVLDVRETLARALAAQGNLDEALEEYEYIIRYQFASLFERSPLLWPLAHFRIAEIYDRTGEVESAVEYYRKFLAAQKEGDPEAWRIIKSRERVKILAEAD